eukprot:3497589-Prymnesium_polylepis.1
MVMSRPPAALLAACASSGSPTLVFSSSSSSSTSLIEICRSWCIAAFTKKWPGAHTNSSPVITFLRALATPEKAIAPAGPQLPCTRKLYRFNMASGSSSSSSFWAPLSPSTRK